LLLRSATQLHLARLSITLMSTLTLHDALPILTMCSPPLFNIIIFSAPGRFASESDNQTDNDDDDESDHERNSELLGNAVMQKIIDCDCCNESEYEIEPFIRFSIHKALQCDFYA